MHTRYLDKIKKNKLSFVKRSYAGLFAPIILCVFALFALLIFVKFNSNQFSADLVFYTGAFAFCIIFFVAFFRLNAFIDTLELQNMMYSNAISALNAFYLIAKKDGSILHQDSRISNDLLDKTKQKLDRDIWPKIERGFLYHKLKIEEYVVKINPMTRPDGCFAVSFQLQDEFEAYKVLLKESGVRFYKIKNSDLFVDSKKLELDSIKEDLKIANEVCIKEKSIPCFYKNNKAKIDDIWYGVLLPCSIQAKNFLENIPISAAIINQEAKILHCNKAFKECITKEQNLNSVLQEKLPYLDLAENKILHLKLQSQKSLRVYTWPLKDVIVCIFFDISDLKDLQQKLQHSQKIASVGKLAGGIAHDFNNILTAIIGFSDILLQELEQKSKEYLDAVEIKSSAQKGRELVKKLLGFARDQKLKKETANISNVLANLQSILRRLISENIDLVFEQKSTSSYADIDIGQFEQCIINLAVNARDAIKDNGKIFIQTNDCLIAQKRSVLSNTQNEEIVECGQYIEICVQDDGVGMEKQVAYKVFDPFFSTKEVGKGTGLGLSTTYGIVKQMSGYIDLATWPKKGSKFTILLPVSHAKSSKRQVPQIKQDFNLRQSFKTHRILLVEDEEMVRKFIKKALESYGFAVFATEDAKKGMDAFLKSTKRFDLVITDVVMPGLSGPEMIENLKQKAPDIKAILISGYTRDKLKADYIDNSSVFFMQKPFELEDLMLKVKSIFN